MRRYKLTITPQEHHIDSVTKEIKLTGSAFELTDDGLHIGHTYNWNISNEDIVKWNINIGNPDVDLQDKTMYRFPKLDLPRQKVDLLKEKYNVKVIRDKDKADVHILSQKYMESILETTWNNVYEFKYVFAFLKSLKDNDKLTKTGLDKIRLLLVGLPTDSWIEINKNYFGADYGDTKMDLFLEFLQERISEVQKSHNFNRSVVVKPNNIKAFNDICNSTAEKVLDVDIIDVINSDLVVLESNEFTNVENMILSSDKDNRSLALEMLANCNINKSFDVVSGIYYWYIEYLRDTTNWNSVNVKAFRKKMHKYENGSELTHVGSYDRYIKLLTEDNKLTTFAVDSTKEKFYKNVLTKLVSGDHSAFNIKIEDVELSNKYPIQNLNIND